MPAGCFRCARGLGPRFLWVPVCLSYLAYAYAVLPWMARHSFSR